MTTTTTTDPRADRARFIASTSSQWLKCHTVAGKRYGVPSQSQPGRYYLVDTRVCDCPDFQRAAAALASTFLRSACTWRASAPSRPRGRWSPPPDS